MKTFALATGSSGNCIYVETKYGGFLVDCGLSFTKTQKTLHEKGIDIFKVKGIFITHEHSDHVAGLVQCMKQLNCPFYATKGTISLIEENAESFEIIKDHQILYFESTSVLVVKKPHDAKEAVSFIFQDDKKKVGMFTDLGHITTELKHHLKNCDCLYLETNYSKEYIQKYCKEMSEHYIHRLTSNIGHLGLHQVEEILPEILSEHKTIILSHISENTNTYSLSYSTIKKIIEKQDKQIHLEMSFQKEATKMFEL